MTPRSPKFGVYVHVPYCSAICPYCSFNVYRRKSIDWAAFADAIVRELRCRAPWFEALQLTTLYFGGGTPSLAPASFFASVISAVRNRLGASATETTLEVNPEFTDSFKRFADLGVNRISLGAQSFSSQTLLSLKRQHAACDIRRCIAAARDAGIVNQSVDLIYAVPGQTTADVLADVDAFIALGVPHGSMYELTFEPRTVFFKQLGRNQIAKPNEQLATEMMEAVEARLSDVGFDRYEISNYCKPGWQAQHNRHYWRGRSVLGLGPGATSFLRLANTAWRWQNHRLPHQYGREWRLLDHPAALTASDVAEVELLSPRQLLAEYFMGGVRLRQGIDLTTLELNEGEKSRVETAIREAVARGWAIKDGCVFRPTRAGRLHADSLALLFF